MLRIVARASIPVLQRGVAAHNGYHNAGMYTMALRRMTTYYTKDHEYIKVKGDIGTVGITDFAQNQLGDVVYVELPNVGDSISKGDSFGSVESVKAASDLYSPVAGEIVEANSALSDTPGLINEAPHDEGWVMKIKIADKSELKGLLDETAYAKHCDEEDH